MTSWNEFVNYPIFKPSKPRSISLSLFALIGILSYSSSFAGNIVKPFTFNSGESISSSKVNADFDALFAEINAKESRLSSFETLIKPSGGNIGIGTTSPAYPLDVNGGINFTGNLTKSGIQQPLIVATGTVSASATFDIPIDLVTYNSVEIRFQMNMSAGGGNNILLQSKDASGTVANFVEYRQNTTTATNTTTTSNTNVFLTNAEGSITMSSGTITLFKPLAGNTRAAMIARGNYCYAYIGQSRVDASGFFDTASTTIAYIRMSVGVGTLTGRYTVTAYP